MGKEESFAECTTCQKSFTGPESYTDHLASKQHEKKMVEARKTMLYSPENTTTANVDPKLRCDICNVTLTGQEPFIQHVNGSKHKNKIKKRNILDSIKVGTPKLDSSIKQQDGVLTCDICEKCFSGPASLKQHVESKKHARKMELQSMKNQLTGSTNPSCPPMETAAVGTEGNVPSTNLYPNLTADYKIVHQAIGKTWDMQLQEKPSNKGKGCFSGFRMLFKKNTKAKESFDE